MIATSCKQEMYNFQISEFILTSGKNAVKISVVKFIFNEIKCKIYFLQ